MHFYMDSRIANSYLRNNVIVPIKFLYCFFLFHCFCCSGNSGCPSFDLLRVSKLSCVYGFLPTVPDSSFYLTNILYDV